MVITSEIVYIDALESMEKFDSIFKAVYCRSAQDLHRAKFFNHPVFICRLYGKEIGYAVLEFHGLKRASLWHGPIIEKEEQTDLVMKELFDCLVKYGIWHLMVYPLNDIIYQSIEKLTKERKAVKLNEANGAVVAMKDISISENEIIAGYKKDLKNNLNKSRKFKLEPIEIIDRTQFNQFIELVIDMYSFKGIGININSAKKSLLNDFEYIQKTGKGSVLGIIYNEKLVGGLIQLYTRNVTMQVNAASDKSLKIPILHYLNHFAILEAKKRNIYYYDFGAMASNEDQKDWDGFTYFKTTFGIERVSYPPTVTLALNRKGATLFKSIGWAKKIVYRLRGKKIRSSEFGYDLE